MEKSLRKALLLAILAGWPLVMSAQNTPGLDLFTIGRIKYAGGGDWYSDPSSLPNLLEYLNLETGIPVAKNEVVVEPSNPAIFNLIDQYFF